MSARRLLKAAQAIREVVGMAILTEIRDPRIQDVTVTLVEVAPDMRLAKIYVSVMGDERKQMLCLHGLQSSAGFLQHKISRRIDTRYTPKLKFVLDKGVKNAMRVTQILKEVLPARPSEGENTEVEQQRPAHEIAHDELRGTIETPLAESKPKENTNNNEEEV
jgi:ribosome-binding factor A